MYEVRNFGFNFRLSDINSALGISQLSKLNKFIDKRNEIANYYNKKFENMDLIKTPVVEKNYKHAYHLYQF